MQQVSEIISDRWCVDARRAAHSSIEIYCTSLATTTVTESWAFICHLAQRMQKIYTYIYIGAANSRHGNEKKGQPCLLRMHSGRSNAVQSIGWKRAFVEMYVVQFCELSNITIVGIRSWRRFSRAHTHTHTLQCIELIQSHWWMSPNGKSPRISHENSLNLSVIDGKTSEPWTWSAMDTLPPALYIWATQQHSKQHNNREPRARWLSVIRDCCVKACGCTECTVFMQHTDWFCSLLLIIRTGKKTYWKWCVLSRCALEHWQLERARNHSEWKFIDYIFFQILWTTQRNGIPIMPR